MLLNYLLIWTQRLFWITRINFGTARRQFANKSNQNKSTASDCIKVLEEEDDDQIINELTGKAECTYVKMKNINLLKKTLEKFNGVKAPVHLVLSEK